MSKKTKKTTKISITVNKEFLSKFDKLIKMKGYLERAPAVRDGMVLLMDSNSHLRRQPE